MRNYVAMAELSGDEHTSGLRATESHCYIQRAGGRGPLGPPVARAGVVVNVETAGVINRRSLARLQRSDLSGGRRSCQAQCSD